MWNELLLQSLRASPALCILHLVSAESSRLTGSFSDGTSGENSSASPSEPVRIGSEWADYKEPVPTGLLSIPQSAVPPLLSIYIPQLTRSSVQSPMRKIYWSGISLIKSETREKMKEHGGGEMNKMWKEIVKKTEMGHTCCWEKNEGVFVGGGVRWEESLWQRETRESKPAGDKSLCKTWHVERKKS